MKVIRLTTSLDFGGQEQQYISFVEGKSDFKNNYIFAAIGHGGYAEKLIFSKGFEVKIFNENPSITNLKNIWKLYKWFKIENPDIVHTAAAEANFHGIIAAKMAGVKNIIAEEIGFPNHSNKARFIFSNLYKLTKKVICVSKAVQDYLIAIDEIDSKKGYVIYNPVSEKDYIKRELPNEFTIVSVGRFEKVKNQKLLINAFSKLNNKSSKLILVGDGRERSNIEQLISELNLNKRVTITGFVPNPEHYIAKSSLFVLPSFSEGFGIAVVEAMQQGLPCLCTNVGGIPEFVVENETGWLFNPNDEDELVEKLNYIITLPTESINSIGEMGKNSISSKFTTSKYVENLENLYQNL
ncbi:glycosyltransferase [Flavobacterium sp.]|uniref:glycosyltransferase n=1 Tax=Flavobacterium sp. TaxID=239 RepID=UPI0025D5B356|nr:glycosyltransferase [Flavobacterium sp.]